MIAVVRSTVIRRLSLTQVGDELVVGSVAVGLPAVHQQGGRHRNDDAAAPAVHGATVPPG